jgi:hypothetical protein
MPLFAATAVFWLSALIATPRRPLPHSPLDEVVYAQLRRYQQRLVAIAICVTMLALLASVLARPSGVDADAEAIRQERVAVHGCVSQLDSEEVICDVLRADGRWVTLRQTADVMLRICTDAPGEPPTCYRRVPGGGWSVDDLRRGGDAESA